MSDRSSRNALPLRLVPAIHRATHRIGLSLSALRERGLSQGEAHILAHLATSSPASIGELHKGLAHKRSTLTSILDRLTARGLVTREVGTADRRTFIIALTPRGRDLARQVHRHLSDLERSVLRLASADELAAFVKIVSAVEQEARRRSGARQAGHQGRHRSACRGS
jgi:DNA-binding MarR family transcriptional regulator